MSAKEQGRTPRWQQVFAKDDIEDMLAGARKADPDLDEGLEMALYRRRFLKSLSERRKAAGISQKDIAEAMGTSQPSIARLERGEIDPRLSTLSGYARALELDLGQLFSPLERPFGQAEPTQRTSRRKPKVGVVKRIKEAIESRNPLRELAQRIIDDFNSHDAQGLAALDHPSVILTAPGTTGRTEWRGLEASTAYYQSWFDAFPDARITITGEVIAGGYIVQEGILQGTNTGTLKTFGGDMPATGKSIESQFSQVIKTLDGLIISTNFYVDHFQVLTQLGLTPSPARAEMRA